MPGKVNPVIPEVVNQTSFLVIGLDTTVTLAASAGQLQLNVMEPVISFALFFSIRTMERAVNSLRENCVVGITANEEHTRNMVLNSLGIVTVLKPLLGYKECAEIAREGYKSGKSLHQIVVVERKLLTQGEMGRDVLVRAADQSGFACVMSSVRAEFRGLELR
ncbi:aspartate ammonia-lyase [Bradyrhizobium sp. GM6.1]